MIKRLCVIGVGLIGGSLALALRRAGVVGEVVGCGRNRDSLARAVELGVIDRWEQDPSKAAAGADVVVVCVPLRAMQEIFRRLRGALEPSAVLTDVGSVKGSVVEDARQVFGEVPAWLVPGHPIAGTEHSGVDAAFAELYERRRVVLTPLAETAPEALERVEGMWRAAGSDVVKMEPEHHDEVLAATSHLPHALAYALVDTLARWDDRQEIFELAAGGFRDFTRIASSDPRMWRDISAANREWLVAALRRYQSDLQELTDALEAENDEHVLRVYQHACDERARFLKILEGRK
ncbi:cyclohexadienyl dehydrogenase [Halorhodospira halochloris]|uniref:prephenate dehydrogenase n=1 Tax=Halorhodospira halochloris TaxID=1052 RepID=A0A110B4U8_HALHR|nr:prephenate dehydrogenase/arogenate dehydrogenase family protein [Halorhodospira halochloris]MBK1651485.1 prephenate dehydrogenase [Halorhodospira halochloris]BAU57252.2 cyclohexadienyl dehydrogenase [Halorhodospira halochloris]